MIRNFDKKNGDLVTGGQSMFLYGRESTSSGIYHRLRMFFGEWYIDITDGVPWFQSVLGKKPQGVAEQAIKQAIITAPDVVAITSFSFDSDRLTRTITIDVSVIDVNNERFRVLLSGDILARPEPGIMPDPFEPLPSDYVVNLNQFALVVE